MKWIGGLLVALVGLCSGLMATARLRKRVASLERLVRLLERLGHRVRYTAAPLEELVQELAHTEEFSRLPFLAAVATERDGDRRRTLRQAVRDTADTMCLHPAETGLLMEFVSGWGAADVQGEVNRCSQYAALLGERLEEARGAQSRRGRLYITLGICAGSTMALVLW